MSYSIYKFCDKGEVESIPNQGSFIVLIDGKIACSMSSGGSQFRTPLEAEVFGRQLVRGYTGGTFLSSDIENRIF